MIQKPMPTPRETLNIFIAVLLFLISISACTTENRIPGYVYFRLGSDPSTLDPALVVDVTGGMLTAKLFNGLVKLTDGLKVAPDIARSWSISKDGLTYRFELKEGVGFSNGREVKASDFKYSFERVLRPETKSPNTWLFDNISGAKEFMAKKAEDVNGIRALDDRTLEIRLVKPFSPFLGLLTMPPAYVLPEEEVKKRGPDFSYHPVGTGPFVLSEWLPGRHLKITRRPDYFDGAAKARGILYRIIPEEMTAVMEFEVGNLDAITVPASEYSRYKNSERWKALMDSLDGLNTYYLGLNCERPPFDDPLLRQAVSRAIDRGKILGTLYEGRGSLASGPVPDALRKWESPDVYDYAPEQAKEIIKGANAGVVWFYINADQQVVDMAEVIQAYLLRAGLNVKLKQLEWSAFKEAVNKGEPDMFYLSWWADYPDPENFLYPLFHSKNKGPSGNRSRYANPDVDALIEAGRHASDPGTASKFYAKAEVSIVRDAPWVFLWHRTDYTLKQPWVSNHGLYPVYSMDKGTDIYLSSEGKQDRR